jgi:MarR family transcriptional regulator, organic hydroperoxide resistance regulator
VDDVRQVLERYPRIYYACHARHRRDPISQAVLSERRASILDHLDEIHAVSLKDLAEHLGVTASTMSISIDRLVRGGWVQRERDLDDGRRLSLRLTAAGARMKDAQSVLDPERVRSLLARLTPAERVAALQGMALLARAAEEEIAGWSGGEEE